MQIEDEVLTTGGTSKTLLSSKVREDKLVHRCMHLRQTDRCINQEDGLNGDVEVQLTATACTVLSVSSMSNHGSRSW